MAGENDDKGDAGGTGGADEAAAAAAAKATADAAATAAAGEGAESLADMGGKKGGESKGEDPPGKGLTPFDKLPKEHQVLKDGKPDHNASLIKAGLAYELVPEKYRVVDKDGKVDTQATLAKAGLAYGELAKKLGEQGKKLGGFAGAPVDKDGKPTDYELTLPEGIQGEFDKEHPLLKSFAALARETGMDQATFTKALHAFVGWEVEAGSINLETEFNALGERANERIADLNQYLKTNLDDDQFQAYRQVSQTANGFKLIEHLVGLARSTGKAPKEGFSDTAAIDSQIAELIKPDAKGVRPIDSDPKKLAEYRGLLKLKLGSGEHHEVTGAGA